MDVPKETSYPLHFAVIHRYVKSLVSNLAKHKDCINQRYRGYTPLMLSVFNRFDGYLIDDDPCPIIVETLLKNGACVDDTDEQGRTPLHMAATYASCSIVRLLLEFGADVNAQDGPRRTPLHLASLFKMEQHNSSGEIITCLLKNGANPFAVNQYSDTPIETLVGSDFGMEESLQSFVGHGMNIHDPRLISDSGVGLLHRLVMSQRRSSKDMINLLIKQGFYINRCNIYGQTPLHMAALSRPESGAIEHLCSLGADPTILDHLERTPLHYIQMPRKLDHRRYKKAVKNLLDHGLRVNMKDVFGCTPLHYAITFQNYIEHVEYLLLLGADVEEGDIHGASPLHYAANSDRPTSLKALVSKCHKDNLHQADKFGATALHYAVSTNSLECVKILMEAGLDWHCMDVRGYNALDLAKECRFDDICLSLDPCFHQEYHETRHSLSLKSPLDPMELEAGDFRNITKPTVLTEFYDSILSSKVIGPWTNNAEAQEVAKEVEQLIQNMAEICQHDLVLRFTPKIRGSVAEGTKCGPPDEFDFMLVMDAFNDICEIEHGVEVQSGYSKLVYNAIDDGRLLRAVPHIFTCEENLDGEIIGLKLCALLKNVLSTASFWQSSRLQYTNLQMKNVTIDLSLRWTGVHFKNLGISIDLVPCIPIQNARPEQLSHIWPKHLDLSDCRIYALCAHSRFGNKNYRETYRYELSSTEFEQTLFGSLSDEARRGYILAKALRSKYVSSKIKHFVDFDEKVNTYEDYSRDSESYHSRMKAEHEYKGTGRNWDASECIPSYLLKSALLWEYKKCYENNRQGNTSEKMSCLDWAQRIYSHLQTSLLKNKVESFFKYENLVDRSRGSSTKLPDQFHFEGWKSSLMSLPGGRPLPDVNERTGESENRVDFATEENTKYANMGLRKMKIFVNILNHVLTK